MITAFRYILTFLSFNLVFLSSSYAFISDYETARVQSSAGAGVASLLINESTVLNPASIAFFKQSTFYYQKGEHSLNDKNRLRNNDFKNGNDEFISFADTSSPINGGFSYQYQNLESGKRIRYAASFSNNLSKDSAFGLIYRYTDEKSDIIDDTYHQAVIGYSKIFTEKVSFGFTIVDPVHTVSEYFHYTAGVQYAFNEFFTAIADIGSGDVQNPDKSGFTKLALQVQSFRQLFIRYGQFHDQYKNFKGSSYGISWVGPKISLDYAYKSSEKISSVSDTLLNNEKIIETSFGLTVLF
jgi:hypothetical protein